MEQQIITDIITSVAPELWYLFLQMLITTLIFLCILQGLRNITAYVFMRFDKELSKNVKVKYEGEEAMVVHISIRHLILKLKSGNEVLIPITQVSKMPWEIIRNNV